ncbi:MAG: hypothetical protein ACI9JN_000826 [Bacteroidia bacterium]|jgi:hypothetical protein
MNNWDKLSSESKVWIYGANRHLTEQEKTSILDILDRFCDNWAAHGDKLDCGFKIIHNQIIVLAVDEISAAASGCSIDTSVKVFQEIDSTFNLDLFNRLRTYQVVDDRVKTHMSIAIKEGLSNGTLESSSQFIDTLITTKGDIHSTLVKPLNQTWLLKYL